MSRRTLLTAAGAGAAALAGYGVLRWGSGLGRERPNVVIIFTDDQGYGDLGCYGSESIKTPVIDSMAAEGIRFTDFYSAASICTPSRAGLLTGCYPIRVGMPHVLHPGATGGINADEITLAELLKARGYATACIGKWHLGHRKVFLPTRHGFEEYFGIPYSNDMGATPKRPNVPPLPLMEGEDVIETDPDQSQLTRRYTERAVSFIKRNKDRPFFLYLPHTMPHVPLFASAAFTGKSARGLYGDVIEEIDWSVGEILKTLKNLDLDEKTLVIFTSDNGPWLGKGDRGGSAGPLRSGKFMVYEGGYRVPCVMCWPGKIPAGKVCTEMASMIDLLPTIAPLAGAAAPADRIIDGKDIWPLMTARPGAKTPHEAYFYYCFHRMEAVRRGDWKLRIANFPSRGDGKAGKPELYNLRDDLGEKNNLAREHPDIVADLRTRMEVFEKDIASHSRPPGRWAPTTREAEQ